MRQDFVAGSPLPKSLGPCVDLYAEVRAVRLAMEKEVEAVKDRETEIREHLINSLSKSDDTGVAGRTHRAQIVVKNVPKVNDWHAIWQYVASKSRFDFLQKRINAAIVLETLRDEAVPGVELLAIPEVSITKI